MSSRRREMPALRKVRTDWWLDRSSLSRYRPAFGHNESTFVSRNILFKFSDQVTMWKQCFITHQQSKQTQQIMPFTVSPCRSNLLFVLPFIIIIFLCFCIGNRSLAFLKMQQYYLAYKDAKQTIQLKPDWAKGIHKSAFISNQRGKYSLKCQCCVSLQVIFVKQK